MDERLKRWVDRGLYGKPGDPVPEANVEDIKAVYKLYDDAAARNPGNNTMIGMRTIEAACKSGADVKAVWFRAVALQSLIGLQKQAADYQVPWPGKVEANDATFRVIAEIPMKWQAPGRQKDFMFDFDDFIRRIGEAA